MITDIPDDWRDRDVTADDDLGTMEKETSLTFPNDKDTGVLYSDVPTIIKWVQSVEESEPLGLHMGGSGEIMGVKARIPKSIVKLQGNSRKSDAHSDMVSYGPLK